MQENSDDLYRLSFKQRVSCIQLQLKGKDVSAGNVRLSRQGWKRTNLTTARGVSRGGRGGVPRDQTKCAATIFLSCQRTTSGSKEPAFVGPKSARPGSTPPEPHHAPRNTFNRETGEKMSADFWAGYLSGAAGIVLGNPLDVLKVRLQAGAPSSPAPPPTLPSPSPTTTRAPTTPSSYIRPFLLGTAAPVLGYGALNALLFVSYNRTEALLNALSVSAPASSSGGATPDHGRGTNLLTTWLAGAVGGLATWVVSAPTELVVRQLRALFCPVSAVSGVSGVVLLPKRRVCSRATPPTP
jgi:hypothetical protein